MTISTTSAPPTSPADPQRAALRDLVALAAEFAQLESQNNHALAEETNSADRKLRLELESAEQSRQTRSEKISEESSQKLSTIQRKYETELADIESQASAGSQRINYEQDSVDQGLTARLQHATWLAESVHEATQNQLTKESKLSAEKLESREAELAEIRKQTSELLWLYGQSNLAEQSIESESPAAPGEYEIHRDAAKRSIDTLKHLQIPRLFVGVRPYIVVVAICAIVGLIAQWISGGLPIDYGEVEFKPRAVGYAIGGAILFCVALGFALRILSRIQVRKIYLPLDAELRAAQASAQQHSEQSRQERQRRLAHATRRRDSEIAAAREQITPMQLKASKNRQAAMQSLHSDRELRLAVADKHREHALADAEAWRRQNNSELEKFNTDQLTAARRDHDETISAATREHQMAFNDLRDRWERDLRKIQSPLSPGDASAQAGELGWENFSSPRAFPDRVRFGSFHVDLPQITDQYPKSLALPPTFSVPATLVYPDRGSLLIHTDQAGHAQAIATLRAVMSRLLTTIPPGRVKFTIIDPVGLGQNFAGFMHLADHDESLVGTRIWTETSHIEQQLANLTEHMETVIQKYLRNEFATIDQYNAQAGELAEPYRYLVIADFPVGFEAEAFRRLASIATSGARCGVFTLVARDLRHQLSPGVHIDELEANSVNLIRRGGKFVWRDEIFAPFPLALDSPPADEALTRVLDQVGREAKVAKRVEVPFESIAPPPGKMWSGDSTAELAVPIGRLGASRLQNLRLGRGVAQHALIAGKTGSGKSTLLNVLITNLAMWYSPDQVEFYLVDFKKGVEFKTYATHSLPHARAIAVESDREFGLSVLQRIDAELIRRGELFRKLGVQDLAGYRNASREPMPRTLLIIDEFQEFFSEDDKLAQEASLLLDRLVRQGRAFGIHVLLGSQTIGGTSGLSRSTIGQIAVRVALQTSEADSQLILGDANSAARLLSRPGEAIYNDAGGLVENNSPFQISWLPDLRREIYLDRIAKRANEENVNGHSPIVFEGNEPADISKNRRLAEAMDLSTRSSASPLIWLGDPVAIKEPTAIALRPQSGANVLIIGQNEEGALALFASSILSLAAQHAPGDAKFFVFDGTPSDSPFAGTLSKISESIPHEVNRVEYRGVESAMESLAAEITNRQNSPQPDSPAIYVLIYGLQRYRMLRKSEDNFSFSVDAAEKSGRPDKIFSDLLREGPSLRMHTIAWIDTSASLDRTLERGMMREFDFRVLFQMSAADSSNLVDSPLGNKLGANRALLYSEELGIAEKFRPYALPPREWLQSVREKLHRNQV